MTRRLAHLCTTGTFSGCLLMVCSSCTVFHAEPLQTVPSREAQSASRLRLAQLSFGGQAAFGVCAEPACPQVTPKTIAMSAVSPQAVARPVVLIELPDPMPLAPVSLPAADPARRQKTLPPAMPAAAAPATDAPSHHLVITFPFGSRMLTEAAKQALAASIRYARESEAIEISGRTDSVGDLQFNQALALSRALAVRKYLRDLAPDLRATISIDAKGRCCFIASNADEEGRARNRRVQVVFTGPRGA